MRKLKTSDAPALAALHKNCFGTKAWNEDQLHGSLSLPTTEAFALYDDKNPIAFLIIQTVLDEHEVLSLGAHTDYRRQGLAKKLLRAFLDKRGNGTLFLEVAADNLHAIALYESLGFSLFSRRKDYYLHDNCRVDALNYRLVLGD